jgi:hypothetical protein
MNKKQRIILAIFIPIIFLFITLVFANNAGYTEITRDVPENSLFRKYFGMNTTIYRKGNPFDWERTWYIWALSLVFCCIFEYKLFANKKASVNRNYIQK